MSALTGGKVNYYLVKVDNPQREEQEPYQAECEDIIQALAMDFNEACEFKALWRTAAARLGNGKPGRSQTDQAIYDAEKRVHYSNRSLRNLLWTTRNDSKTEPVKTSKSDGLEWIVWKGLSPNLDRPPMGPNAMVHVIYRDNQEDTGKVRDFHWADTGSCGDIVMYRFIA